MTKLYQKSEITFAVLWIAAYVVLTSLADQLSASVGVMKSVTAALHVVMTLVLFFWIRKNHLGGKYGFCRSEIPAKRFFHNGIFHDDYCCTGRPGKSAAA